MKKTLVMGMLVLSMAVSSTACSSGKEDTAKEENTQNTDVKKSKTAKSTETNDTTDTKDSSDERNAYGLTKEQTEKLAELVKEKVTTQYLEKYGINAASFALPEYVPEENGVDLWTSIDEKYLKRADLASVVVTAAIAGDKSDGIEKISAGISDGTFSFKESAKEQNEVACEWYTENNPQEGDLAESIYEGIAKFLNSLDDAERAEVLYDVYDANIYQGGEDEQGRPLHTMFDQVIIENVSFK